MLLEPGARADAARALRWPGTGPLMALEARLRDALQAWAEGWGLGPVELRCEPAWLAPSSDSLHWQSLAESAQGSTLAWLGSATREPQGLLAAQLFGSRPPAAGEPTTGPLADSLGQDAWRALRLALATGLHGVASSSAADSAPPAGAARVWSGAVRATLKWGEGADQRGVLHASAPAWCAAAVPAPAPRTAGPALQPLHLALARHQVRLQARVADVPVALGELLSLRPGDVLLTPQRLADPLSVFSLGEPHPPLYAAHLAQRDGRMAAVLLAPRAADHPNDRLEGNRMNSNASAPHDAAAAQWLGLPEAGHAPAGSPALAVSASPLLGVKTTLQVCVGEAVLTVGELTQARAGQVIKLDREVDGLVDLLLDGRVVARGQLVAVDDCFAVRLTELPLPLNPASAAGA